jgi:predicted transposase YdaD
LWRRDHLPVRSVAVLLREAKSVPEPSFVIPWGKKLSLRHDFDIIRLWELPQEQVLGTPYYALWPLASLMASVTTESTVAVAERIAGTPALPEERSELTTLLVALAGIRLQPSVILNALRGNHMMEELLRESGVVQEWMAQGRQEGGRQKAQLALEGRFGALDAEVLAALAAADEATQRDLVAHVATDTPEQMRARLGLS